MEEERRSFGFWAIHGYGSSWFKQEEGRRGKFASKEENQVWKLLKTPSLFMFELGKP